MDDTTLDELKKTIDEAREKLDQLSPGERLVFMKALNEQLQELAAALKQLGGAAK